MRNKIISIFLGSVLFFFLLETKATLLSKIDTNNYALTIYSAMTFTIGSINMLLIACIIGVMYYIAIVIKEIMVLDKIMKYHVRLTEEKFMEACRILQGCKID